MKLEQLYTNCLAHAAYYVESEGEVAIFDPLRETAPYIELATNNNATIKYIFETHFHADFVSGHLDLAKKTGAKIVYGPTAKPNFVAHIATDNEVFTLGKCLIKAIHTPGHTLESTVYLIYDEDGKEHSLISGDTLFIGDVGRPDLAQHVIPDLTENKLARMLYHSLRNKIMPLNDDIIIYPNHGAGSACGKNMSKETSDTLGHQKQYNYALNPALTEDEFVTQILTGLTPPPNYFPSNVLLNINGYEEFESLKNKSLKALSIEEINKIIDANKTIILDTRDANDFAKGFIPTSINIGLNGNFAQWVGELILDIKQPIILITEVGKEVEAITRLSRIGFDNVIGYLVGGFISWENSTQNIDSSKRINAVDLEKEFAEDNIIIDVRKKSEFEAKHIVNAINIPLNQLKKNLQNIPRKPFVVVCAGGYRSMIASSILILNGIKNFVDVIGGMTEIEKTTIPTTEFICPTTML